MLLQAWEAQGMVLAPWEDLSARLDPSYSLWGNQMGLDDKKRSEEPIPRGFHSITSQTPLVPTEPSSTDKKKYYWFLGTTSVRQCLEGATTAIADEGHGTGRGPSDNRQADGWVHPRPNQVVCEV